MRLIWTSLNFCFLVKGEVSDKVNPLLCDKL